MVGWVTPKTRVGMSGGPVLAYVDQPVSLPVPRIRIVGVTIEHRPDCLTLVATKTDALMVLIRKAIPGTTIRPSPASVIAAKKVKRASKAEG
jgi:hypothetical protein